MRKIIVLSMISLDGVMQAPGGPKEDTSGGFKYGGWTAPYSDEIYGQVVQKELQPADYLEIPPKESSAFRTKLTTLS